MQRTKTLATEPTHASHNCPITNATLPIKRVEMDAKPRVAP